MTTQGGEAACSVLGLDISSFALHGCLLVPGQAPVLRMETLGTDKEPLIERLRRVWDAVYYITRFEQGTPTNGVGYFYRPDWIVIEDAFGRNRNADRALNRTIGAIVASVPSETQIAIVSTGDWRRSLSAKNTKAEGHTAVRKEMVWTYPQSGYHAARLNEHELDAIGIALAWQRILAQNVLEATP